MVLVAVVTVSDQLQKHLKHSNTHRHKLLRGFIPWRVLGISESGQLSDADAEVILGKVG